VQEGEKGEGRGGRVRDRERAHRRRERERRQERQRRVERRVGGGCHAGGDWGGGTG
jgi:hypothetical protein